MAIIGEFESDSPAMDEISTSSSNMLEPAGATSQNAGSVAVPAGSTSQNAGSLAVPAGLIAQQTTQGHGSSNCYEITFGGDGKPQVKRVPNTAQLFSTYYSNDGFFVFNSGTIGSINDGSSRTSTLRIFDGTREEKVRALRDARLEVLKALKSVKQARSLMLSTREGLRSRVYRSAMLARGRIIFAARQARLAKVSEEVISDEEEGMESEEEEEDNGEENEEEEDDNGEENEEEEEENGDPTEEEETGEVSETAEGYNTVNIYGADITSMPVPYVSNYFPNGSTNTVVVNGTSNTVVNSANITSTAPCQWNYFHTGISNTVVVNGTSVTVDGLTVGLQGNMNVINGGSQIIFN